jgi:hypothetical protein
MQKVKEAGASCTFAYLPAAYCLKKCIFAGFFKEK